MKKIERAIISVTDKEGIVEFARDLQEFGVEILSTGGTAKKLREGGIKVRDISDYTGSPEILGGRVKTLHPKIHGGILGRRDVADHVSEMKKHDIFPIDMVLVNLYEFEKTVARKDCTLDEAVENIDIGGPTMLRSSAKNYKDVTVIVDPADYAMVLDEMGKNNGATTLRTRFYLARKVFAITNSYDRAISGYLKECSVS
jgi:phosphoribosylaminoimidazolecarboxamide formyltransferase/IMP cyclohydrolase